MTAKQTTAEDKISGKRRPIGERATEDRAAGPGTDAAGLTSLQQIVGNQTVRCLLIHRSRSQAFGIMHVKMPSVLGEPNNRQIIRRQSQESEAETSGEVGLEDLGELAVEVLDELASSVAPGYALAKEAADIVGRIIHGMGTSLNRYIESIRQRERPSTNVAWSRSWLKRGASRLQVVPAIMLEGVPDTIAEIVKDKLWEWAIDSLAGQLVGRFVSDSSAAKTAIGKLMKEARSAFMKVMARRAIEQGVSELKVRELLEGALVGQLTTQYSEAGQSESEALWTAGVEGSILAQELARESAAKALPFERVRESCDIKIDTAMKAGHFTNLAQIVGRAGLAQYVEFMRQFDLVRYERIRYSRDRSTEQQARVKQAARGARKALDDFAFTWLMTYGSHKDPRMPSIDFLAEISALDRWREADW